MQNKNWVRLHKAIAFVIALMLFGWIVGFISLSYQHIILMINGEKGIAIVTDEHYHGVVSYKYEYKGVEYTGKSAKNLEEQYRNVKIGDKSLVFISSSNPGISSLAYPYLPMKGIFFFIFLLLFEIGFILRVIYLSKEDRYEE